MPRPTFCCCNSTRRVYASNMEVVSTPRVRAQGDSPTYRFPVILSLTSFPRARRCVATWWAIWFFCVCSGLKGRSLRREQSILSTQDNLLVFRDNSGRYGVRCTGMVPQTTDVRFRRQQFPKREGGSCTPTETNNAQHCRPQLVSYEYIFCHHEGGHLR